MSENESKNWETSVISDSNLAFELGQWTASNSISVTDILSLLGMLQVFQTSLPKDPRTLSKTLCQSSLKVVLIFNLRVVLIFILALPAVFQNQRNCWTFSPRTVTIWLILFLLSHCK